MSRQNKPETKFLIDIQSRENATWQGRITFIGTQEEKSFRSALELIRLMDEVVRDK